VRESSYKNFSTKDAIADKWQQAEAQKLTILIFSSFPVDLFRPEQIGLTRILPGFFQKNGVREKFIGATRSRPEGNGQRHFFFQDAEWSQTIILELRAGAITFIEKSVPHI
jgi:hypothetical protein